MSDGAPALGKSTCQPLHMVAAGLSSQGVVPRTVPLAENFNVMTINNLLRVSVNRAPAYDMCPNRSVRPKTGVPDCSYQHGMSCIEEQESKFGGKQRRTENDRGRVFRSGF